VLADQRHPVEIALAVVGAAHPLEHRRGPGLQRQVNVLAEGRQLGVGADHVLAHVLRVGARVADPVDPRDSVDPRQELGKGRPAFAGQVAAVAVDVLAEQRHLAHAFGGEALDLGDQLRRVAALLAAAGRGDDAIGANAVAPLRDL
jgi:hypothetical protein